jgi:hypothetical protein
MIITYDLPSYAPIVIDDAPSIDPVDPSTCAELRLETVASSGQTSSAQDFSAVIGQQVLAQLSG